VRIIKPGKPEAERLFTASCRNCGAQFEFRHHEGEVVRDSRDGDFIRINCPTCMTFVTCAL
jgi:hypothetical protein